MITQRFKCEVGETSTVSVPVCATRNKVDLLCYFSFHTADAAAAAADISGAATAADDHGSARRRRHRR